MLTHQVFESDVLVCYQILNSVQGCTLRGVSKRLLVHKPPPPPNRTRIFTFLGRIDSKEPNSASLAGRYDNPIPIRFLAPIDCLKIPTQFRKRLGDEIVNIRLLVELQLMVYLHSPVNKK